MKRFTSCLIWLFVFTVISSQIQAGENASAQFDKLKSLVGEWRGKSLAEKTDGKNVTVTYELVSNGATIMERLMPENEPNMITMYHLDRDNLMMTHYCAAHNQPRMLAEPGNDDEKVIRFSFIDATNLAKPTVGHMHKLAIKIHDNDLLTHEWTWRENEKENVVGFEFTRKKMTKK